MKNPTPDHRCPISSCNNGRTPTQLMCAAHWSLVPRELQGRVYEANRKRKSGTPAAKGAHLAACRAAIQAARAPQ